VPVAGLALILGIDRFMSEARAITNLVGNGVATVVVGSWTGDLDRVRMRTQLERADVPEEPDVELRADELEQRQDIAHPQLVPER
jgi:aerobic C4-dicarboxylate transport protein